jgi:hypothetical protein
MRGVGQLRRGIYGDEWSALGGVFLLHGNHHICLAGMWKHWDMAMYYTIECMFCKRSFEITTI